MAHVKQAFNFLLCFSAIALTVVVSAFLLLIIYIKLEYIGFASTLNSITLSFIVKVNCDQHGFAIGLVDQVIFFDVGQCLPKQCVTQCIDNCGLACAITCT